MTIELQDKLYTSTQVADILGVSLRTLYRYMEDGRIKSMRTASGRHRFTKDQIVEFLNAGNMDIYDEEGTDEPKRDSGSVDGANRFVGSDVNTQGANYSITDLSQIGTSQHKAKLADIHSPANMDKGSHSIQHFNLRDQICGDNILL